MRQRRAESLRMRAPRKRAVQLRQRDGVRGPWRGHASVLSLTGVGIDDIRHAVLGTPVPAPHFHDIAVPRLGGEYVVARDAAGRREALDVDAMKCGQPPSTRRGGPAARPAEDAVDA